MDLILNLLKQLAATLSPSEFLIVLGIIVLVSFTAIRFTLKLMDKKGGLGSIFASQDPITILSEKIDKLTASVNELKQFDTLAKTNELFAVRDRLFQILDEMQKNSADQDETIRSQITGLVLLKKDLTASFTELNSQLDDVKHQLKMHDAHDMQVFENFKEVLHRSQEVVQRVLSQLEKVDEFTRAMVPEFRSYHKELSKELGELSRDVALVERSVQAQINTMNAVKLR